MEEFTQAQAAMLSGYDERAFRSLLDKRIILASPSTRNSGRGKAKTFLRHEVRVASVLNRLDLRLSVFQQAGIADWLRQHLSSFVGQAHDAYAVIAFNDDGEAWQGWIHHVRPDQTIPITIGLGDEQEVMDRFVAASIKRALFWDEDGTIEAIFSETPAE